MPDNTQDNDLINGFLNGDESAFNKLIRKYQTKIYWQARRMSGSHDDADEILQEVLLVVYNKLNTFKFESSFSTWLYRITATRSINYIKKRDLKKMFSLDVLKNKSSSSNSVSENIESAEQVSRIEKHLQKLPPKQREVFIMRAFDELSYDEIASITGKSAGSIKANYFHAAIKMKELLSNE